MCISLLFCRSLTNLLNCASHTIFLLCLVPQLYKYKYIPYKYHILLRIYSFLLQIKHVLLLLHGSSVALFRIRLPHTLIASQNFAGTLVHYFLSVLLIVQCTGLNFWQVPPKQLPSLLHWCTSFPILILFTTNV